MEGIGLVKGKKCALLIVSLYSTLFPVRPASSQEDGFLSCWGERPALRKECCLQTFTWARSATAGISASILLLLPLELPQVLPNWHHVCIYHQAPALSVPKLVNTSWGSEFPILVWSQCSTCGKGHSVWFLWSVTLVAMFWAFPGYNQCTKCLPAVGPNSATSFWSQCWTIYTRDAHVWSKQSVREGSLNSVWWLFL